MKYLTAIVLAVVMLAIPFGQAFTAIDLPGNILVLSGPKVIPTFVITAVALILSEFTKNRWVRGENRPTALRPTKVTAASGEPLIRSMRRLGSWRRAAGSAIRTGGSSRYTPTWLPNSSSMTGERMSTGIVARNPAPCSGSPRSYR